MFNIQISNPNLLGIKNDEDTNIEEAIESIFPLDTEYAFMIWNKIFIPLSYKYDVPVMIKDMLKICMFTSDTESKTLEIHWASNTFSSIWFISKESENVRIKSKWNSVMGKLQNVLNDNNEILISSDELNSAMLKMIRFIRISLEKVGYSKLDLEDFGMLEKW